MSGTVRSEVDKLAGAVLVKHIFGHLDVLLFGFFL